MSEHLFLQDWAGITLSRAAPRLSETLHGCIVLCQRYLVGSVLFFRPPLHLERAHACRSRLFDANCSKDDHRRLHVLYTIGRG